MGNFHVYHISFFEHLLNGLETNGVSLEKISNKSFVHRFNLDSPTCYLPLPIAYELVSCIKKEQGIDCITSEFYGKFILSDLSEFGQFLSQCPDLYSLLTNGMKLETLIHSNGKLILKTDGALSTFSKIHFDKPSVGRTFSERGSLAMMLKAFQHVLGFNWSPVGLRITDNDGYWLQNILPHANYSVITNSPDIAIIFKTSELTKKNKLFKNLPDSPNFKTYDSRLAVERTLQSMVNGYAPTLEEFSSFFGYSRRTTIRSLANMNSSYKQILEKHLFMKSLELLEDENLQIDYISTLLGYAHPSNFIRAFRRWTNTTPKKYREQLRILH